MFPFFRKIRKKLTDDNQFFKYSKYAIGEIVLVVIGILIALQINTWNENRKNKELEKQYLNSLITDLKLESESFNYAVLNRFKPKINALLLAKNYYYGNHIIVDTLKFINTVGYGGVFSSSSNFGNIATYQELVSSSSFKMIRNKTIKKDIINYYGLRDYYMEYYSNMRTGFAAFNNSLKPYNPEDKNAIDSLDIKRTLEHYKSEEFLNLINQELTFGYSINNRVKGLDKGAKDLIIKIEKELNQNHDTILPKNP